MKVRCPKCSKKQTFPDQDEGQLGVCLACGASFPIAKPPPTAEPAAKKPVIVLEPEAAPEVSAWRVRLVIAVAAGVLLLAGGTIGVLSWWHAKAKAIAVAPQVDLPTSRPVAAAPAQSPRPGTKSAVTTSSPRFLAETEKYAAMDAVPSESALPTAPEARSAVSLSPETPPAAMLSSHQLPPLSAMLPPTTAPSLVTGPTRPRVHPVGVSSDQLTDEKIGAAITRGATRLLNQFNPRTHLLPGAEDRDSHIAGLDILCVYALMQAQQATNDPRLNPHDDLMKGLIDAMKRLNLKNYRWETYARGLRATALALYDRPEDREVLKEDATALVKGTHGGGFTYTLNTGNGPNYRNNVGAVRDDGMDRWDNSNSQYGLLGVWSAAEVGFEVSDVFWNLVQRHWTTTQNGEGTWGYSRRKEDDGTHSMTCAGLASLLVTHDYLDVPKMAGEVGRDPYTPALARGLRWLERGNNSVALDHGAYDLYGLERVGLASGYKFFGKHEWYREMAGAVVGGGGGGFARGGGMGGGDVESAYTLLFLARGRHPILMNKVRFDGYWANRPRDVANLARYAGYQLERQLNWQIVPLSRDWTDWMDSPILYIASHKAVKLSEADYTKIRTFVMNGGLLFMQADGGSPEFNTFAREAAHKLFPAYEMGQIRPADPLYHSMYQMKPNATLQAVNNGARTLMLYSSEDLAKSWQLRDSKYKPFAFQLGTNLFIYAAGKRDLRNHLVSTVIPQVNHEPTATFKLARLKYAGNWDPEPEAWHRFSRWFHLQTGYGLTITDVPITELKPESFPIAQLTGTAKYDLTDAESAAIKAYVEAGGVLLVDLCGGTGSFDQGMQTSLYFKVFGGATHAISRSHPIFAGGADGMENLSKPLLRQYAMDKLGATQTGFPDEISAGKGHVIATSLDITSGLLGTTTWGIAGYEPNYSAALVKNIILWTIDGQHEETPLANR
jgi:hypothetical protein